MSKPWGTSIGSWAAEAEREEAEEREMGSSSAVSAAAANPQSFPSLKDAVSNKPRKKKMTLSEFNTYGAGGASGGSLSLSSGSTRLTPEEMMQLPTGPKQRSPDEFYGSGQRLGGAFSNYSDDRRGPRRGGFDDDRRGPRRGGSDFDAPPPPSRADEVDDWAAGKRSMAPPPDSGRSSSRYSSLGGGSRADEVDNWNFGKKPAPPPGRSTTFGSNFRDSGNDWRRGDYRDREEPGRPKLVLDPPSRGSNGQDGAGSSPVVVKTEKPNPFGAARPREEVLAEKGLDWKKLDSEIEAKKASSTGSRPTSSQGSRPTSSQSNRSESIGAGPGPGLEPPVKPRPKVNPFGEAKPREVLLEEKGLDWRKIDLELEHRRVIRPETEEERVLKEEIENLKKGLASQGPEGEQANLRDLLQSKKRDLETLTRELDDKVRFSQKAVERPGSGAGRFTSFPERPPSQSGSEKPGSGAGRFTGFSERPPSQSSSYNDVRGPDTMDRPRSRGTADVWTGEDRRGSFHGGRDRGGFLGNRDFDRSRSRERW